MLEADGAPLIVGDMSVATWRHSRPLLSCRDARPKIYIRKGQMARERHASALLRWISIPPKYDRTPLLFLGGSSAVGKS